MESLILNVPKFSKKEQLCSVQSIKGLNINQACNHDFKNVDN